MDLAALSRKRDAAEVNTPINTSESPTWWTMYFVGYVQRTDATPFEIVTTCADWYDGKRSAMWRFFDNQRVKPRDLVREASKALGENTQGDAEDKRLEALMRWAIHQENLCEAARSLRAANEFFATATSAAEMEPFDAARMREAAEARS